MKNHINLNLILFPFMAIVRIFPVTTFLIHILLMIFWMISLLIAGFVMGKLILIGPFTWHEFFFVVGSLAIFLIVERTGILNNSLVIASVERSQFSLDVERAILDRNYDPSLVKDWIEYFSEYLAEMEAAGMSALEASRRVANRGYIKEDVKWLQQTPDNF